MQFYVLDSPSADSPEDRAAGTEFIREVGFRTGNAPTCPACGRFIGMLRWLPPYRVELRVFGGQFGDLAFGSAEDLLVSERFKCLYEEHGLRGLSGFESVDIVKVKRRRKVVGDPPRFFRAAVTRSRAEIDYVASKYEWGGEGPPNCSMCRIGDWRRRAGIVIDPMTWPGEDIFIARAAAAIIATERFKRFCDEFALKNAVLKPAETCAREWSYP